MKTTWLLVVTSLLLGGILGWVTNGWRLSAELSGIEQAYSQKLQEMATASEKQLLYQQEKRLQLEQELALLDTRSHKELTNAIEENDRLQRLYSDADNERRRLRIDVKVARSAAIVSASGSTCSVGDGASFELSERAGRAVWNIRRGVISDQKKLIYLQDYVKQIRGEGY
ncbi:lysis system i-spanin subunit Rz [Pseudomonas sp. TTU2014-080ASC]|uniref:lysis system i-spanin subunit Rz n=1 Tax=Pseudomonas sp. TTU2014-080ASC TaxID=1729724 RepID=UPI0007186C8F|nr:lysis system i-spanin subunit Rz [Pseudomonas sp. TTU2014-080ASC]KRW62321.1 hypothetical protein AO726_02550 [Pseudomonas sp. TTU2014-080ASC]